MEKYERLDRKLVYKGSIIDMFEDTVQVPNGNVAHWDFIGHKGAAGVLPVMDNGKILLVKQWRNALDRFTYEIPAGGLENPEEPMSSCAIRELEEETGYKAEEVEFLISIKTTVAFCNERIDIFLARNLIKTQQKLDEDENIEIYEFELNELIDMIKKGKIQDAKTVSAIFAYRVFCEK